MNKLHWYSFCFISGGQHASISNAHIFNEVTAKNTNDSKRALGLPNSAVMVSVSYLGHMTKQCFYNE